MYAAVQGTCVISPLEVLVPEDTTVLEDNEDEGVVLELVVDVVDTGAILLVLDVDAGDDVGCTTQDD
jgi:uncharacterized protein YaaQ